jgi:hypothetical protein
MDKPKVGKPYVFIRAKPDGAYEHTEFVRHADGSAGFFADGFFHVHEGAADAWRDALRALGELQFEELGAAKARGSVPGHWQPTDEAARAPTEREPRDEV